MSDAPQPPTAGCRISDPRVTDGIGPPTCDELYAQLRTVDDPVLGDDIVSLGLVDDVSVDRDLIVVEMGLYAPYAPNERRIVEDVHEALRFFDREIVTVVGTRGRARARRGRLPSIRNVVPFVGRGGAVDVSTVTVNVAFALSRIGARVGVLTLGDGVSDDVADGAVTDASVTSGTPATVYGVSVARASTIERAARDIEWGGLDYLFVAVQSDESELRTARSDRLSTTGPVVVAASTRSARESQPVSSESSTSTANGWERPDRADGWVRPPLGVIEMSNGTGCEETDRRVEHLGGERLTDGSKLPVFGRIPDLAAIDTEHGTPVVWADHEFSTVFDSLASGIADAIGARARRAHGNRVRSGGDH